MRAFRFWRAGVISLGVLFLTTPLLSAQDESASRPTAADPPAAVAESQPTAELQPTSTDDPASAPATAPATPAMKRLGLADLYGSTKVDFDGDYAKRLTWAPQGPFYFERRDEILMRVEAVTDQAVPAFDHISLAAALREHAGIAEESAAHLAKSPGEFSEDRSAVLIEYKEKQYLYNFAEGRLREIRYDAGNRELEELSPRAGFVSFVRDNNLFATDIAAGTTRQLTRDGSATMLCGKLDWVYQEEVYGRGKYAGHWWSADDSRIAFLQLDESRVPIYTIVDPTHERPEINAYPYPKVGDPNPVAKLGVVPALGGPIVWIDLSQYAPDEQILIVRVAWAPDGKLIYQVQNRRQSWLDLNEADPATGKSRTIFRDATPAWFEAGDRLNWLTDGTFLWLSERDGHQHLYHYTREGALIRRITAGDWDVHEFHGVGARDEWVYFSGTRDGVLHEHAYRVPLRGGPVQRLTELGRSHHVAFDADFRLFIDTSSTFTSPPRVELRESSGRLVRIISANESPKVHDYELGQTEFLRVPARDGRLLPAMLVKPPNFDPARRYPVWCMVYAGPQSPEVADRWSGRSMFMHLAAQEGFVVWQVDPRSASADGAVMAWQAYQRLGEVELADIEDSLKWLIEQGVADPKRIGIEGYSYGGFMTCYALTHSDMFAAGIAGGSVTDWRYYDSIYTERYMGLLSQNKDGYVRTAPVTAAENLRGRLLLVHGAVDDNVHYQNSLQMMRALQKHDIVFDSMVYPRDQHSLHAGDHHFARMRMDFMERNLMTGVRE